MRRYLPLLAIITLALVSMLACQQEYDAAYDGWKRYQDQADGYEILIPRDWTADDDIVLDYRSTRFAFVEKYNGPESVFIHISVTCQDLEAELTEAEIEAKVMALPIIASWEKPTATIAIGKLANKEVTTLRILGKSNFVSDNLAATVYVRQAEGKLYIVTASSTERTFPEVSELYGKILKSFKW
jgi:hypothetical protein